MTKNDGNLLRWQFSIHRCFVLWFCSVNFHPLALPRLVYLLRCQLFFLLILCRECLVLQKKTKHNFIEVTNKSSKLWSSQLRTQFKQLRIEAWKSQDFNGVWLFQASIRNCLNCVRNCDDHSLLDFKSAVQYMKHFIHHFMTNKYHMLERTSQNISIHDPRSFHPFCPSWMKPTLRHFYPFNKKRTRISSDLPFVEQLTWCRTWPVGDQRFF